MVSRMIDMTDTTPQTSAIRCTTLWLVVVVQTVCRLVHCVVIVYSLLYMMMCDVDVCINIDMETIMDEQTAQALEKSIKHWEENVERAEEDDELVTGQKDCALCGLFWNKDCIGCPVSARTGRQDCCNTPYIDVCKAETQKERISACTDELNFLRSLREEKHEEKDTNMIDMKKTYTTRDGMPVRIYAVDAGSNYPVHGAYLLNSVWYPCMWPANGRHDNVASVYDLIEAPVTYQMWVNIFDTGPGSLWSSRKTADMFAAGRIACVPVTITYRHGEGLDNDK